jgi:hypothetical protein
MKRRKRNDRTNIMRMDGEDRENGEKDRLKNEKMRAYVPADSA